MADPLGIWITIKNTSDTIVGDGPITSATGWRSTARLDRAGTFNFTMPASDPRATLVVAKYTAWCYGIVGGAVTLLGAGIIDSIETTPGNPTMLTISGDDLLRELTYRLCGTLHLREAADITPIEIHFLASADPYATPPTYTAQALPNAYDGNVGTSISWNSLPGPYRWMYVGSGYPFDHVNITMGTGKNGVAQDIGIQYLSKASGGWVDVAGVVDGTKVGSSTFAQSGTISFTDPGADMDASIQNGYAGYWVRISPTISFEGVEVAEVKVPGWDPSGTALADVMAKAPAGWALAGAHTTTQNEVYSLIQDDNVLEAIVKLAEICGEHFRLGTGRTLVWLQDDPTTDTPVTRAIGGHGVDGVAVETNADVCLIRTLRRTSETYGLYTRLYPYGAGLGGNSRLDLTECTQSPPAGYTLSVAENYLENDTATATYGRIDKVLEWKDVGPATTCFPDTVRAANQLYLAAMAVLDRASRPNVSYDLSVVKAGAILPGQKVTVCYHEYVDGVATVSIDEDLYVLEATTEIDQSGVRTVGLVVSTVDIWAQSEVEVLARAVANVGQIGRYPQAVHTNDLRSSGWTASQYPLGLGAGGVSNFTEAFTGSVSGGGGSGGLVNHSLVGSYHTATGLTAGNYLRASNATTFGFAAILDADLPATVVRTSRTLTAGAGLTGGGDLSADRTLAVGAGAGLTVNADDVALTTPGTLTVSTTNASAGNHTHGITSSSNPGAAASLLATDASGHLRLAGLGIGAAATANDLTLGDSGALQWSDVALTRGAANTLYLGAGDSFQSADFTLDSDGFSLEHDGSGYFTYLYTKELHAKAVIADLEQALAGAQMICKSVAPLAAPFTAPNTEGGAPIKVILDTDLGNDCDDMGALAMLMKLHDAGEIKLLCVGISTSYADAEDAADALLQYYGHDHTTIPIGKFSGTYAPGDQYTDHVAAACVHDIVSAEEVVAMYRHYLAQQPAASVTFLEIGPQHVLRDLLESVPDEHSPLSGSDLVAQKCVKVVAMGGNWPNSGSPEWNLAQQPADANWVAANCPVPIYYVGNEVGGSITVGESLTANTIAVNPIRVAYENTVGANTGQSSWDPMATLYACRGLAYGGTTYFTATQGAATINASTGANTFAAGAGTHYYLTKSLANGGFDTLLSGWIEAPPTPPIDTTDGASATGDDGFNTADGALGADWTGPIWNGDSAPTIGTKQAVGAGDAYWDTATFGPNSQAWMRVRAKAADDGGVGVSLYLRVANPGSPTALTGYLAFWESISTGDHIHIYTIGGNPPALTEIGTATASELAVNDVIAFRATGTTPTTLQVWRRSVAGVWAKIKEETDAGVPYTAAGYAGFSVDDANAKVDDFHACTLTTVADVPDTAGLTVEEYQGFGSYDVFVTGDWIRVRTFDRSGTSLTISDCYGTVGAAVHNSDNTQTYTFTRAAGTIGAGNAPGGMAAGTVVPIGSLALDYGVSGNGYIESVAQSGAMASGVPHITIRTWDDGAGTDGPGVTDHITERVRIGNLRDSFGVGANDYFGAGFGDYTAGNYLRYDQSNGFLLKAGDGAATIDANGVSLAVSTAYEAKRSYTFNAAGAVMAYLTAYQDASTRWQLLYIPSGVGRDSDLTLASDAPSGKTASATLSASGTDSLVSLGLVSSGATSYGYFSKALAINTTSNPAVGMALDVVGSVKVSTGINVGSATGATAGEIKCSGDIDAAAGINVGAATGADVGDISIAGGFTGAFKTGAGKSISKSVANNTDTGICEIIIGGAGALAARYLVTFIGNSTGTLFEDTYLVSQNYDGQTVTRLGALSNYASRTTSVTVTATADSVNRRVSLNITQVNNQTETCTVRVNVIPLGVSDNQPITVAAL